jgi:hypothetical protein
MTPIIDKDWDYGEEGEGDEGRPVEYDDGSELGDEVVVNQDGSVTVKPNPSGASRPDPGTPEAARREDR